MAEANMADVDERVAAARAAVAEATKAESLAKAIEHEYRLERERCVALRNTYAKENDDVEDLEGWTLTRVIASLTGRRDQRLFEERGEREIARLELAVREEVLADLAEERDAARRQTLGRNAAEVELRAALEARGEQLVADGGLQGQRLADLNDRRSVVNAELAEVREAINAAQRANAALERAATILSSAGNWSTYDTFFGGGMISSAIKHDKMNDATQEIRVVHRALLRLQAEVADLGKTPTPTIDTPSSTLRGMDIFFDNIFSDWMVHDRIRASQSDVESARVSVVRVRGELERMKKALSAEYADIDDERQRILNND